MKPNLLSRLPFLSLLTGKNPAQAAVSARSEPIAPQAGQWVGPWAGSPQAKRCAAIVARGHELGQLDQAMTLAFESDVSAAASTLFLEACAQFTTAVVAPTGPTPESWAAQREEWQASRLNGRESLARAMAEQRVVEANREAAVEAQSPTPDALVDQILAVGAAARFDDPVPRSLSLVDRGVHVVSVSPGVTLRAA